MATTYSGDPRTSDKDRVRFLLGDTSTPWTFTDEEILYVLETQGNVYASAAELATIKATEYADKKDKTVGPLSISYGESSDRWLAVAKNLRGRSGRTSGAKAVVTQTQREPYFRLGGQDSSPPVVPETQNGGL